MMVRKSLIVQLLQDRALTWAQAVLHVNPEITFSDFLDKFKSVFDRESSCRWPTLTRAQTR